MWISGMLNVDIRNVEYGYMDRNCLDIRNVKCGLKLDGYQEC